MNTTSVIVWRALLDAGSLEWKSALSTELLAQLAQAPFSDTDLSQGLPPNEKTLDCVDPSWFAPFLRSLSENDAKLFVSSLRSEQIQSLKGQLRLSNTLPRLTSLGALFIRETLFKKIAEEGLLPLTCLPQNRLNQLLDLSSQELYSLIDLLSMHDLAVELKHIIETTKIKQIQAILTKAQTTFLKTLLHTKEPVTFKKMGLVHWKGDQEALISLLQQRGINRMAKALYGQHPSLLWHIAHRLNADRGSILITLCAPMDHPKASQLLIDQILEIIPSFNLATPPNHP